MLTFSIKRLFPRWAHYSAVELLVLLGLLFVTSAFVEDLPGGDLIEVILLTVVMVSSLFAVGGRRRSVFLALLLVVPAIGGKWINHFWPSFLGSIVYLLAGMAFFVFVVARLIRFVLRAPHVDANVLCAGLSGYLLLGLLWVPAYVLLTRINPAAFNLSTNGAAPATLDGFNGFYFSFITLCTVGYGDIIPASKGARMLAVTEAIAGVFYVTVLISRLVAIYSTNQPAHDAHDPQSKAH